VFPTQKLKRSEQGEGIRAGTDKLCRMDWLLHERPVVAAAINLQRVVGAGGHAGDFPPAECAIDDLNRLPFDRRQGAHHDRTQLVTEESPRIVFNSGAITERAFLPVAAVWTRCNAMPTAMRTDRRSA